MPYLVNKTNDDLRVPELGRVVAAGERIEVTDRDLLARFAGHPAFNAFEDDDEAIPGEVPDWSAKTVVLAPEYTTGVDPESSQVISVAPESSGSVSTPPSTAATTE